MGTPAYDDTPSNWNICEIPGDRRFLAGKVTGDCKGRFREGAYIKTSLIIGPVEAISDGKIVETLNSRYLLTERYTADDEIFAKLDAWLARQPFPPTVFDVLATPDIDLLTAYTMRHFRAAAAEAAWKHRRRG